MAMEALCMVACGIVWRNTADEDAGWELVTALGSPDPELRQIARQMLAEQRDNAMELLEAAITAGILTPEAAWPCMGEMLRRDRSSAAIGPFGTA
jgi:hypothetical protein